MQGIPMGFYWMKASFLNTGEYFIRPQTVLEKPGPGATILWVVEALPTEQAIFYSDTQRGGEYKTEILTVSIGLTFFLGIKENSP